MNVSATCNDCLKVQVIYVIVRDIGSVSAKLLFLGCWMQVPTQFNGV